MRRRVQKSGLRVPQAILKQARISPGYFVDFKAEDYAITIRAENPIWQTVAALAKKRKRKIHAPRR